MKNILFFLRRKNCRVSYSTLLNLSISFLITLISFDLSAQCGMEGPVSSNPPVPYADCVQGSPKCIKVKIHFINNTYGQSNAPDDNWFRDFLQQVNNIYAGSGLSFTFDDECIHRVDLPGTSKSEIVSYLGLPTGDIYNSSIVEDQPPLHYKNDFVNIFIFQDPGNASDGFTFTGRDFRFFNSTKDVKVTAHEMGHALSLNHTSFGQNYLDPTTWECIGGDATKADMMADTEADPGNMDLDRDGMNDKDKFYNGSCGSHPAIFNYADACGSKAWKPPYDNYMNGNGNTRSCWTKFSPCQISAMHRELDNLLSDFVTNCNTSGGNHTACSDNIVISQPTVWTDMTIYMCPGKRITITPSGSLTLVHSTITKNTNSNCPNLSGNWDGIYIEGSNYGGPVTVGNTSTNCGGKVQVLQGSVIEHSINGIQAPGSHNGIIIDASTIRENGMAIYATGTGGGMTSGSVRVVNGSFLSNTSIGAQSVMVRLIGCSLTIEGSTLENKANGTITGIKSYNGKVTIRGSKIKDFYVGVDKSLNGPLVGVGLVIEASSIINASDAIKNTSSGVSIRKNYIDGKVHCLGKAYGRWYGNRFLDFLYITNPSLSHAFQENGYVGVSMDLAGDHALSDATCNTWLNADQAVSGQANRIKSEWGNEEAASGNKWDNYKPIMEVYLSNDIKNYEWLNHDDHVFIYIGKFTGKKANGNNCIYNQFPLNPPAVGPGNPSQYNDGENRQTWENFHSQYQTAVQIIPSASGTQLAAWISQRENAELGMGQCVLLALENIGSDTPQEMLNYWSARLDAIYEQQSAMLAALDAENFSGLATYLNELSLTGVDATDRDFMVGASIYLQSKLDSGFQVKSLPAYAVADLVTIGSASFGNYTALLRAFLTTYYDISIFPPQQASPYSSGHQWDTKVEEAAKYQIVPNPTRGSFKILHEQKKGHVLEVDILTADAKRIWSGRIIQGEEVYVQAMSSGLYILRIKDQSNGSISIQKVFKY